MLEDWDRMFSGRHRKGTKWLVRLIPRVAAASLGLLLCAVAGAQATSPTRSRGAGIHFGLNADYAPYEFRNAAGKADGFNADIVREVGRTIARPVELQTGPWSEMRAALTSGGVDALAGMLKSEARARTFDFSAPILTVNYSIFVRRGTREIENLEDLRNRKVIVERGSLMHDRLRELGFGPEIVEADSEPAALMLLASGTHDAALVPFLQGRLLARDRRLTNVTDIGQPVFRAEMCFAVAKGRGDLLTALDEGLAVLKRTGRYGEIYGRWFGEVDPRGISLWDVARVASLIAAPLLALLAAAGLWTVALRRTVENRTRELEHQFSERLRAEGALRDSEVVLDAVYNGPIDALFLVDAETNLVVDCNRRSVELFEADRREDLLQIMGHKLARTPIPDEAALAVYATVSRGQVWSKDVEFETRKGNAFWGNLALAPLHLSNRNLLLGRISDITAARRAEETRLRLTAAIHQASEAIVITDDGGLIQYVNPAFERITGYPAAEAIGQSTNMLKSGRHDAGFYRTMWETIRAGRVWSGHMFNRRRDGSLYEEESSITPVRDDTGRVVNYVAVKRDVTRETQMEAHLRQQQKLESIGTLASGVAHEINNPLTGILNYAQLISEDPEISDEVREFSGEIVRESERVASIVRDLLSFARQDRQPQGSCTGMGEVVQGTLSLVRTVMRHDQIRLEVDIPENLPPIRCRSQQIQQVILNLLTNARDSLNQRYPGAAPEKTVRVSSCLVEKDGGTWVRTTVEDHGTGIPPEIRDRIFDPFFTTKHKSFGTGLGLSISHGIVREHEGELWFETEPGGPTRFHLDLRAVEARESARAGA